MSTAQLLERINQLTSLVGELKSLDTPGNYTSGQALYGNTVGKATSEANFVWDTTSKRLGISGSGVTVVAPTATLNVSGGISNTVAHFRQSTASPNNADVFVFAGIPGLSFNRGGFSYNWRPISGGVSGKEDAAQGASYLEVGPGIMRHIVYDAAGTAAVIMIGDISASVPRLSFFGLAPVIRQVGGAATADLTWSANEVAMLNTLWTMARNYGLLT